MDNLISRQAAIEALAKEMPSLTTPDGTGQFDHDIQIADEAFVDAMQILNDLPSAQPEYSMDEWCTDCTEYDQEHHCCPRFNRVIRETVDEVKANQWIPCSEQLPESDGVYLVYAPDYRGGSSSAKEWHNGIMFAKFKHGKWSVEVGYYNRPGCVRAWMPIPEPFKEDQEGKA